MSMIRQGGLENSLQKTQLQINFAAPGSLNTDVVGVDQDTGINQFSPRNVNALTDITNVVNPAAGLQFSLFVRRLAGSRTRLGTAESNFLTTLVGTKAGFPKGLAPGFFQFVEQQTLGALTAQQYNVTFAQPLAV